MPNEGLSTRGMKGLSALSALCLLLLGGCAELAALDLDPFNINGRQGAHPLGYDTLMRLGAANTLMEMGQVDEAILSYKSALQRVHNDPEALRGLAKAYLRTARPELAGAPLSAAYKV